MVEVTVDFVARCQPHGGWALVLVEEGPWGREVVSAHLSRLQERLYGCLDAALDGAVAARYPESQGKALVIRVNAFNVPEPEMREFFRKFADGVPTLPDYASALASQRFFPSISFELNVADIRHGS
jgi:hypothetical protein